MRGFTARTVQILSWFYLLFSLSLWVSMRLVAEHTWFSTLLIYSPRWIWATPLLLLIPAAMLLRRKSMWVLIAATYLIVWPIMDLRLPWHRLVPAPASRLTFRVLTCNGHGEAMSFDAMRALIARTHPDVVAIEECSEYTARRLFPADQWHLAGNWELWTASRFPIVNPPFAFRFEDSFRTSFATRMELMTPAGILTFYTVHLASPHSVFSAALRATPGSRHGVESNAMMRLKEATMLAEDAKSKNGPLLIAGDFNLTRDSAIYRRNFSGFSDAFSVAGFGFGWTYRVRWTITRIDHVLTAGPLRCRHCWVASDVQSPHRPLIADFLWTSEKSPASSTAGN